MTTAAVIERDRDRWDVLTDRERAGPVRCSPTGNAPGPLPGAGPRLAQLLADVDPAALTDAETLAYRPSGATSAVVD